MKTDIHPKTHPVIFRDKEGNTDFYCMSTLTSDIVEEVDGVKYFVITVEVSAATHPFYTGKQKLIDTAGKADKFRLKMEKAEAATEKKTPKIKESVRLAAGRTAVAASAVAGKKLVNKVRSDKVKRELKNAQAVEQKAAEAPAAEEKAAE